MIVEAGGKVIQPVEDVSVGKAAVMEDPFGNRFTLVDASTGVGVAGKE